MMRARLLAVGILMGCATPHRPPTVPPARIEMERLAQRHFLHGEASAAQRATLARLLDLHGRGAEAALLEAPDDPARAERAWFAGSRATPFTSVEAARRGLPIATARYPDDPRAIRTLWLLAHAARLDRHVLEGLATRWRADWPASDEARVAAALSRAPGGAPPIDLDAWARSHPLNLAEIRAADAQWRAPADLAGARRWAAVRVLAVWHAGVFDVRSTHVPRQGPVVTRRFRADHVPTAADRIIRDLDVRVWGPRPMPQDGAPTPVATAGGWMATATGIPARQLDTWAPSAGPRWARAGTERKPRRARLHWRLTPSGAGWRGTLTGHGLTTDFGRLLDLHPGLTVTAVRRLPMHGDLPGWRAAVRFVGAPRRSLLDDAQVEALGGPIALRTLVDATRRLTDLSLGPAQVDIRLTTPEAWQVGVQVEAQTGWQQTIGSDGPKTLHRAVRRPAIDWPAGTVLQRRAPALALQTASAEWAATAPEKLRRLIGAATPDLED